MATSSEAYLISSILREEDIQVAIKRGVLNEHFHAYPEEWDWIQRYFTKHRKIPTKGAFKQQFPDFKIKAVNDTQHYSDEVRSGHARFMLTSVMRDAAELIANGNIGEAVKLVSAKAVSISSSIGDTNNDSDIIKNFEDVFEEVSRRVETVNDFGSAGVPTGFTTLDERTGGAQAGHFWVVAARLNQGKSWSMMRMGLSATMAGYNVQYDALEMTRAEVTMRIHAFLSGDIGKEVFSNLDLMQGRNFDLGRYREFLYSMKKQVKGRLHVSDSSRGKVSTLTIASQIERNKPDIVFIDYLTLMEQSGNDWQSVAKLSGEIKSLAMQYQIPIVAASQINRSGTNSKEPPGAEFLAQSDSIGQDADVVITMQQQSRSVIQMKVVKNRHGFNGFKWFTEFKPSEGIFREVTRTEADSIKDADEDFDDQEDDR